MQRTQWNRIESSETNPYIYGQLICNKRTDSPQQMILRQWCLCLDTQSCPTLSDPMDCSPPGSRLLCVWAFSRQEYWSGLPCPHPGDLPNPGIKPRSPARRRILYHLSHQESQKNAGLGSLSLPQGIWGRNWTGVSWIAVFFTSWATREATCKGWNWSLTHTISKCNSKWTVGLNRRAKTMKLLKEKE